MAAASTILNYIRIQPTTGDNRTDRRSSSG
jgi:hypothetical protein